MILPAFTSVNNFFELNRVFEGVVEDVVPAIGSQISGKRLNKN
jgi:hypothetical protein